MKIGIDLGGSHVGVGIIEESELLISKDKIFSQDKENIENSIVKYIDELIQEVLAEKNVDISKIEMIGVAAPGTVSNGCITAYNLGLKGFNLQAILEQKYTQPIRVRNDGKCAALAEKYYGAMKDYDDCVFVNIGTGVGGAAFLGGKLLEPAKYSGFEFGHITIVKDCIECTCGKRGCLERYASIKSLKTRIKRRLNIEDQDISGQYMREELMVKYHNEVRNDVNDFIHYLSICNLIDIFEPEVICFGGSFSYYEGHPVLRQLIDEIYLPESTFNDSKPDIVTAEFKNNAGIIGATVEF